MQQNGEETRIKIVEAIKKYRESHDYAPTVREIGELVGLKSTSTVHNHLKKLKEKGIISYVESGPRTLSVIEEEITTAEVTIEYESVG